MVDNDAPDFALIQQVAADVQMQDVVLVGSKVRRLLGPAAKLPKRGQISIDYDTRLAEPAEEDQLIVEVRFDVRAEGIAEDADASPVADIGVTYAVVYRLRPGSHHEEAALQEFADTNAVFNVWPYFREFVQNMSSRARIPPVAVPLFRVPAPREEAKANGQGSEGASPQDLRRR